MKWPEKLYTHPDSAVAADKDGVEVFRGMRVRIGMSFDVCADDLLNLV